MKLHFSKSYITRNTCQEKGGQRLVLKVYQWEKLAWNFTVLSVGEKVRWAKYNEIIKCVSAVR